MITYQSISKSKQVVAYFDLTDASLLSTDFITALQNKITDTNKKYFNPDYWYLDTDNLYKLKKETPLNFNIIYNISPPAYDIIIGFNYNNTNHYIYYDTGGSNKNENGFKSKIIYLPKNSYLTIQVGTNFVVGKRFYFGRGGIDVYNSLLIYLTEI
jgi:hypothetical protein